MGDESLSSSDSDLLKILNYEITFKDFFMALTTWLKRQDQATKGRRCTLKRFEAPNPNAFRNLISSTVGSPPSSRASFLGPPSSRASLLVGLTADDPPSRRAS